MLERHHTLLWLRGRRVRGREFCTNAVVEQLGEWLAISSENGKTGTNRNLRKVVSTRMYVQSSGADYMFQV